jgi:transposase-like protein
VDSGQKNAPWSRRGEHAEWARMYSEDGMSFAAIARQVGVAGSTARDQVAAWFNRNGYMNWRRCRCAR